MEHINTVTVADNTIELTDPYTDVKFPSLVSRVKGVFVDFLLMLLIFSITSVVINQIGDVPNVVKGFISIFMIYLYDPVFVSLTGSTLGHKVMGLKVKRFSDPSRNLNIVQAMIRFLAKLGLGWISFLIVTSSKYRRAIHDVISGSVILKSGK